MELERERKNINLKNAPKSTTHTTLKVYVADAQQTENNKN